MQGQGWAQGDISRVGSPQGRSQISPASRIFRQGWPQGAVSGVRPQGRARGPAGTRHPSWRPGSGGGGCAAWHCFGCAALQPSLGAPLACLGTLLTPALLYFQKFPGAYGNNIVQGKPWQAPRHSNAVLLFSKGCLWERTDKQSHE